MKEGDRMEGAASTVTEFLIDSVNKPQTDVDKRRSQLKIQVKLILIHILDPRDLW